MIAGIAFQVVTMTCCVPLMLNFAIRFYHSKTNGVEEEDDYRQYDYDEVLAAKHSKFILLCDAVGMAYTTLLIRWIYGIPEMVEVRELH